MVAAVILALATLAAVLVLCLPVPRRSRAGRRQTGRRTLRVPGDFATIQAALDAAADGDTVLVAAGTYRENLVFRGRAVTVTSLSPQDPGVRARTVIDGTGRGATVTFDGQEPYDTVLAGFTITGGTGRLVCVPNLLGSAARAGGGIYLGDHCCPVIRNCVITGNRADLGGGIYTSNVSRALIEDCTLVDNEAILGGGLRTAGDFRTQGDEEPEAGAARKRLTVLRCTISRNRAAIGGGVSVDRNGRPALVENTVCANEAVWDGGGIAVWDRSSPHILRNRIEENRAGQVYGYGGGISIFNSSAGTVAGNTITANSARGELAAAGGGVAVYRSQPELRDNHFAANRAPAGADLHVWGHAHDTE